ncbi:MAG: hypothetical protein U9R06_01360 [Patescibacteria group bacterium]|nr:hypothetical protein [Patescibacteria group bacterium]
MGERIFEMFEVEVELRKFPDTIVAVVTHGVPLHADDIFSIEMIASEATPEWVKKNCDANGTIQLDVPGSRFCDKSNIKKGGKKEAMCKKVAWSLGILHNSRWKKFLEYVNRDDIRAGSNQTDILSLLKHGQQQNPYKAMEICEWFLRGLAVKSEVDNGNKNFTLSYMVKLLRENSADLDFSSEEWIQAGETINSLRRVYFSKAMEELRKKIKTQEVLLATVSYNGKRTSIAAVESINYRMQAAMRAKQSDGSRLADVVIVKSPGGVLVNHCQDAEINLAEPTAVIRYLEARKNGVVLKNDWKVLREPGTADVAPAWFFNTMSTPAMLMNSLSHDAPPTKLSLKEIFQCVIIALDEGRFHARPSISNFCRNGVCKLGFKCPNLQMGLARCVKNYLAG